MTHENFSVRKGHAPLKEEQTGGMDEDLRTLIWNVVLARLFGKIGANQYGEISQEYHIFLNLQRNFFKLPMDEIEKHLASRREWYKDLFATMEWWRVYDFVEFVARRMIPYDAAEWERDINAALVSERAGYRLVGGSIVPFTDEAAVAAANEALEQAEAHERGDLLASFKAALAALALRPLPDPQRVATAAQGAVQATACYVLGREDARWQDTLTDPELAISQGWAIAARALLETQAAPATGSPLSAEEAEALLTFTACFVTLIIRRAVLTGRIPARDRIVHRPIPPDPWGERKLRS
jgi:AbiJ N-terminal domain 4